MLFQRDDAGVPVRVIGTNTDVTERRRAQALLVESEERFRSAMEFAAIGMALVGLDGRFLKVNASLCEIVGYSEAELLERTFQDITFPDDLEKDVAQAEKLREGAISHYHLEKRYVHKRGHPVWALLSGSLVRTSEGAPKMFVAEVQDISDQKRAEAELLASLAEKDVLLREVHHRVKNNLQVITSLLRMQASQLEHPAAKAALEDSQRRVQTMALIHEQLYKSQNLAGIDFAAQLSELARTLVQLHARPGRSVMLTLNVVPVNVDIDTAVPLGLLANELITNALRHAYVGRSSGELLVELARSDAGLRLVVADDGIGFPYGFSFETSKSMGALLIRSLARQLRGVLSLDRGDSSHGRHNAVTLALPVSTVRVEEIT